MQTEDYIVQEDLQCSKYPLSKKHVMAIGATAFIACSMYFVMPKTEIVIPGTTAHIHSEDDTSYDEMIDPTRSLTDVLLNGSSQNVPATNRDVVLGQHDTQEVFTREGTSFENYDDIDADINLSVSTESEFEDRLAQLAAQDKEDLGLKPYGPKWITEEIQRGDTLSSIFSDLNIPYAVLQAIADNETTGSGVTNLHPGNKLYFSFDDKNNLMGFVEQINSSEQWHFSRTDASNLNFDVKRELLGSHILMIDKDGKITSSADPNNIPAYKKRGRLVVATIKKGDSFSGAAHAAGLTYSEIQMISDMFKGRVQFTRHIQPGDTIRVLFSDDKGEGKINAVELNLKKFGTLATYRNLTDDKYYDEKGYNSSFTSFRRFPIEGKIVISSQFNPQRRHPVTGKVRPHNGTDFAVRVGTPIVSPADGIVEIAKYSRSAGYYIVLRHRGGYSTVYMHLSKLNVKAGQRVKIGETIARSGNTGISTGPHLHYELRLNNKPINAMRVTLPANEEVAQKNRQRFANNVAIFKKELYQDDLITKN